MSDYYILRGHETVPTDDHAEWGRMFADRDARRVGSDTVGAAEVSTVFIGMDHSWGDGPPLLFETMIFGGPHNENQWRWTTWDEAEAGHRRIVEALTAGRDPESVTESVTDPENEGPANAAE